MSSKRKAAGDSSGSLVAVDLDQEQIAALQSISENLHPHLKPLLPLFETIRQAYNDITPPHKRATRQATDFRRTTAAAQALGVDYKEDDISYVFNLRSEHLQDTPQLSEHFAAVIKDLKTSDYVSVRHDESFCRTVLDLLLVDRLRHLEDRDAHHRLQVAAEVPVSIRVKDLYGNYELVKGKADWALGYGVTKNDIGAILLAIEAKAYESAVVGMPQLLVYMAAVYEARRNRTNKSVFGMVSDSKDFKFAFLDENKKLFTSRSFLWASEHATIIGYIDMMLISAIESSSHTTLQKRNNQVLLRYPEYLRRQWEFGTDPEVGAAADDDEEQYEKVDIVNVGGRVVLRSSTRLQAG